MDCFDLQVLGAAEQNKNQRSDITHTRTHASSARSDCRSGHAKLLRLLSHILLVDLKLPFFSPKPLLLDAPARKLISPTCALNIVLVGRRNTEGAERHAYPTCVVSMVSAAMNQSSSFKA